MSNVATAALADYHINEARKHVLGLTRKEMRAYSFARPIRVLANSGTPGAIERDLQSGAPLEWEAHRAIEQLVGRAPVSGGIYVPMDVQRDMSLTSSGGG